MGKEDHGESGSVEVIMPDGFGSSFSTKEIRAKVIMKVSKLFRFLTRKKIYLLLRFPCSTESLIETLTQYLFSFQFVRKVYATLLSQLAITIVIMLIFLFVPAIRGFYCVEEHVDENGIGHCLR